MTDYDRRLERLEAQVNSPTLPLVVHTYSDSPFTEAEQIANARRINDWPDDGAHPIIHIHHQYVKPDGTRT